MKSYLNQSALPRGIRNNNPGNIILLSANNWQGKISASQNTDGHFEQFTELVYGIRALALLLVNKVNSGQDTITKIINAYAPPNENNTVAYIQAVSQATGTGPNDPLSLTSEVLQKLIRAIIEIENGTAAANTYVTDQDIIDGVSYLPAAILQRIGFAIKKNAVSIAGFFLRSRPSIS